MVHLEDGRIQYTVMISSSVNGYEDQLKSLEALLTTLDYDVIMSMAGTMRVNPHLHNFDNCLKAVEDCDAFIGIIRPVCGTGRVEDGCVTFDEFKKARELHKPCWYLIDNRIKHFKSLLRSMALLEHPMTSDAELNEYIRTFYDKTVRARKDLPRVLDLFEPNKREVLDPLCFEMEDFVNHKGLPKKDIVNNWMQYYEDLLQAEKYIRANFSDKNFIADIINERI